MVHSIVDRWHDLSRGMRWFLLTILLIVGLMAFLVFGMVSDKREVRDIRCLSLNIYHEARGESEEGQLAVATVTMNRVASGRFPNTICDVVRQYAWNPKLQRHISHFSWTGDKIDDAPTDVEAWQKAVTISRNVLSGTRHPDLTKALFYHADNILPTWGKKKKSIAHIGAHIFYP
ncbi:MAG: cell wall hydrolase [Gammaproteobacteria bacterium]|nr:cell wall hydrolase [Gammaproteobacteria bacterium]